MNLNPVMIDRMRSVLDVLPRETDCSVSVTVHDAETGSTLVITLSVVPIPSTEQEAAR